VEYGWAMRKADQHRATAKLLPSFVKNYMKSCKIVPTVPMDKPISTCFHFYNNFHIGSVSFFLREDVQHFLNAVNASEGLVAHRWGDSPIQAYAVRLFMDPARLKVVPDLEYIHGSHKNRFVSTFGNGSKTNVPFKMPFWNYDAA
jgi:hypothetical protein